MLYAYGACARRRVCGLLSLALLEGNGWPTAVAAGVNVGVAQHRASVAACTPVLQLDPQQVKPDNIVFLLMAFLTHGNQGKLW